MDGSLPPNRYHGYGVVSSQILLRSQQKPSVRNVLLPIPKTCSAQMIVRQIQIPHQGAIPSFLV